MFPISLLGMLAPAVPSIDHAPLLVLRNQAMMLAPEREAWAVARLERVGPSTPRELRIDGQTTIAKTFDLDLAVKDGWNVPADVTRAFWWEDDAGSRRETVAQMVGQNVLVRFAPAIEGRYQLVSGTDAEPYFFPTFDARKSERFVSILLPYNAERLESGSPAFRRWATLWRAGASLSPSAYPDFDRYIGAAPLPSTPQWTGRARMDASGKYVDNKVLGGADVEWLLRLAKRTGPEFGLFVAEYLDARGVAGMVAVKRELVLRAIEQPEAFPNGLFRVADHQDLYDFSQNGFDAWFPQDRAIATILTAKSPELVTDLLELVRYPRVFVKNRAKLLPLLTSTNGRVRAVANDVFATWQGKPPKDADPVAWHGARAKLGKEALAAAKAAPGG